MHAGNREPHDDAGSNTAEATETALVRAEPECEPERGERGADGDRDRERDEAVVVAQIRRHAHGRHADVVHSGDGRSHRQGACCERHPPDALTARDREGERRGADGDGDREEEKRDVVGHRHARVIRVQPEGEHADEVHAPDADAHRERAATDPGGSERSARGGDASDEVEGDV